MVALVAINSDTSYQIVFPHNTTVQHYYLFIVYNSQEQYYVNMLITFHYYCGTFLSCFLIL